MNATNLKSNSRLSILYNTVQYRKKGRRVSHKKKSPNLSLQAQKQICLKLKNVALTFCEAFNLCICLCFCLRFVSVGRMQGVSMSLKG